MASPNPVTAGQIGTGEPSAGQPGLVAPRRRLPFWVKAFPFFTSAIFFMSGIFAIFAPIPLVFLNLRSGRAVGLLAVATNCAVVYFAGGSVSLGAYAVFVAVLAVALAELLRARHSVEVAAGLTLFAMFASAGALLAWFAHIHHVNPVEEIRTQVSSAIDLLSKNVPQGTFAGAAEPGAAMEDWKQSLLVEFPSAIAIFALVMIWANIVAVLRINPAGIREKLGLDVSYFKSWRAPEWLVWPTIAAGVFLVVDAGHASEVALNVFKFLMAIYTIQGLSILSFFFDLWNVRGAFRVAGYLISIFVMMPLLLSLGFFDLWFDFRAKFRPHSNAGR